jgi:hypothetical protein
MIETIEAMKLQLSTVEFLNFSGLFPSLSLFSYIKEIIKLSDTVKIRVTVGVSYV